MTYHDSSNQIQTLSWTIGSTFSMSMPKEQRLGYRQYCLKCAVDKSEGAIMFTGLLPYAFVLFQRLICKPRKTRSTCLSFCVPSK